MTAWRANCSNYFKHVARQLEAFATVTTYDEGITIFNYLKEKWDNIKQSYLVVLVSFPEDPGPAEEEMFIE